MSGGVDSRGILYNFGMYNKNSLIYFVFIYLCVLSPLVRVYLLPVFKLQRIIRSFRLPGTTFCGVNFAGTGFTTSDFLILPNRNRNTL